MLGDPDWGHLEVFDTTAQRIEVADVLDPLVAEALVEFTADEFLAAATPTGWPRPASTRAADLVAWDHLAARGFFQPVTVADGATAADVLMPGAGVALPRHADRSSGAPPPLGDGDADAGAGRRPAVATTVAPRASEAAPSGRRPSPASASST